MLLLGMLFLLLHLHDAIMVFLGFRQIAEIATSRRRLGSVVLVQTKPKTNFEAKLILLFTHLKCLTNTLF